MTKLLSFDTSTKNTGVSYYVNGQYVASTVLSSSIKDTDKRLTDMIQKIYTVLNKANADIVVVENDSMQKFGNMRVVSLLSKLIGAVEGWCIEHDTYCCLLDPSQWRSAIGIQKPKLKREDFKKLSIQYAKDHFVGDKDIDDNEADAINIGCAYIKLFS